MVEVWVGVGELSERILQPQGDGGDQKKWFTKLIAGNSELMRRILGDPGVGVDGGETEKKRKREDEDETDDEVQFKGERKKTKMG